MNPLRDLRKVPNLGLGYLSSVLKKEGHEAYIFDMQQKNFNMKRFLDTFRLKKWDIVGFQTYTASYASTIKYASQVKKIDKKIIVVVGGSHPSAVPSDFIYDGSPVDYVFVGESENSIVSFLNKLKNNENISDIDGVVSYASVNKLTKPTIVNNLDDLPFPDWMQISPLNYSISPIGAFYKGFPFAPIITTRGCPFSCRYCATHSIYGFKIRNRSSCNISEEVEFLIKTFGVQEIQILDDNFSLNKEHALEVCEMFARRTKKVYISFPNGLYLPSLDKELVKMFEKAGVYAITVGIDSGSERILKEMKRPISKEIVEEKISLIREFSNIRITGNFILGFPSETQGDIRDTIEFANRLPIHRVNYHYYIPLPGSDLYSELMIKKGSNKEIYEHFKPEKISYIPDKIDVGFLRLSKMKAIISFYCRIKILTNIIRDTMGIRHLLFLLNKLLYHLKG